jgi:hypothetical protein
MLIEYAILAALLGLTFLLLYRVARRGLVLGRRSPGYFMVSMNTGWRSGSLYLEKLGLASLTSIQRNRLPCSTWVGPQA